MFLRPLKEINRLISKGTSNNYLNRLYCEKDGVFKISIFQIYKNNLQVKFWEALILADI